MSQIDNDISVHDGEDGDEPRNGNGNGGNGTGASPAPRATSTARTRSSSKRAPAASKSSTPRKRKASSANGSRSKKKSAATAKATTGDDTTVTTAEAETASTTEELHDAVIAGEAPSATEELRTEDEVRGADASAAVEVSEPVEEAVGPEEPDPVEQPMAVDDAGDEPEPVRGSAGAAYFEVTPLGEGPSVDAPDEAEVEPVATTAASPEAEPDADDDGAAATDALDPEYLATLPPPPVAASRPHRSRPPKPARPAARDAVIDLDDAGAERPDVTVDAHGITVEAQEPVPDVPLPLTKRAQFWVRRRLRIPSDDPDYLATLPPPPTAIDLRAGDDEAEAGESVQQRPLEVSALAADQRSAGSSAPAAPSASVTDPAEEQHVPDAAAPTVSSSGPGGGSGDGPFDLDDAHGSTATDTDDDLDLITAPAGQASADTSTSDEVVDLSEVQDPTESTVLPTDEDELPRWVGRTDEPGDGVVATPTRVEPARTDDDEDDGGDDTVVAPLPKQSRAERRKEWRKVEQARRYASRRSVRFPILTRSIILWCLIFALAGMAAGGTAALFWSHFNTEIAELREKTDDFEQRSQTAEARIEDLRKQAIDDINRGKAELAPALAEGRVVQAASIFSPFVWFVDTFDDDGRSSVGSAFAVNSDDRETILITSFNTVKASTVRPSPEINLRKGGDVVRAELVQWDAERDLALLKIDRGNQAVLDWADDGTQRQQLGSRVYAVSGLGGAGASVNPGVVSDQIAQGFLHDVRLGGQSQGSPIVTAEGKVIGVASQVYRPLNIDTGDLHYAVRIDMACERLLDCSTVARRARG